jgi:hypothetical protein
MLAKLRLPALRIFERIAQSYSIVIERQPQIKTNAARHAIGQSTLARHLPSGRTCVPSRCIGRLYRRADIPPEQDH